MNQIDNDLWDAVHKKDLALAEQLLQKGADIESKDVKGRSILRCYGMDVSYKEINEWLIKKGADINSQDNYGDTALHEVIKVADLKAFDWLMTQNINVNVINDQGSTPLLAACAINKIEMMDDLLAKGADPNITSKWGNSPLFTATGRGRFEMVEKLLEYGADAGFIDKDGKTVIHEARPVEFSMGVEEDFKANIYKIIELILDKHSDDIDLNKKTNFNTSILSNAFNNEDLMIKMIEKGTNSNVRFDTYGGMTPLHIACKIGSMPLIEAVLNSGFDFSVRDDLGKTAPALLVAFVIDAIQKSKAEIKNAKESMTQEVSAVLNDPDVTDEEKEEIKEQMKEAISEFEDKEEKVVKNIKEKLITILEKFIGYGLDVNALYDQKRGMHIMHIPVILNDLELAEKLLDLGFPVNPPAAIHKKVSEYNHRTDSDIKTFMDEIQNMVLPPLLYSVEKLNPDFVEFFIKNGADINAKDFDGNNALVHAIHTEEDVKVSNASKIMSNQSANMTPEQRIEFGKIYKNQYEEIAQGVMEKRIAVVDKLIDNGIDINNENEKGATVAMYAAKINAVEFMGILAKRYNADLLYRNENDDTALSIALTSGNSLLFREMAEFIRAQGRFEETKDVVTQAILTAPEEFNEKSKFLKSLYVVGNDPLWLNNTEGGIPLIAAIDTDEHEIVKVLIEAGANVKIKDEGGNTPLIYAVANKDKHSVLLLRSAGADVNEPNNKGITPIALSRSSEYAAVRIAMNSDNPNILEDRSLSFGMDETLSQEDVWSKIPTRKANKFSM